MLNPSLRDPAPIFAALGDRTRLALLDKLGDGQARSIAALSTDTALTRQAITKHLHVLQDAGLVASLRVGRESRFAARHAVQIGPGLVQRLTSRQWDETLERLKAFVEG